MTVALTRRSALAAFIVSVPMVSASARASNAFPAAIRRAQAADAADREAGRLACALLHAGLPLPANWQSYRASLRQARSAARFELHALTPSTDASAAALVAYYQDRADASGEPMAAHHAARRRLRKVFRRPGAVACPAALARASPE